MKGCLSLELGLVFFCLFSTQLRKEKFSRPNSNGSIHFYIKINSAVRSRRTIVLARNAAGDIGLVSCLQAS